jgi:hydroxymethylpyrimidine/phosphomethylpyrimidine kinase
VNRAPRTLVALSIGGSDPSGGAGIQADLRTFAALGVSGAAVVTVLTAQGAQGVTGTHAVPAAFVADQLTALVADLVLDAIKIGMLGSREVADAVGAFLVEHPNDVVVLDPVMVTASGDAMPAPDSVEAVRHLLPLVDLVTADRDDVAHLLGTRAATDVDGMIDQARALREAGVERVLVKGGHLGGRDAVDVLVGPEGEGVVAAPWVDTPHTHGAGCALSSAVAALRPGCETWPEAVLEAKQWLSAAIRAAADLRVGRGCGPVHHLSAVWGAADASSERDPGRRGHR